MWKEVFGCLLRLAGLGNTATMMTTRGLVIAMPRPRPAGRWASSRTADLQKSYRGGFSSQENKRVLFSQRRQRSTEKSSAGSIVVHISI